MAMKWLIGYARARNEKSMAAKLAGEIMAAAKEEGAAVKKRMDVHQAWPRQTRPSHTSVSKSIEFMSTARS